MTLTTLLHVLPKLRTSGAMPLLPLYAFLAWTGKNLPFILEALIVWSITCTEDSSRITRELSFNASQNEKFLSPLRCADWRWAILHFYTITGAIPKCFYTNTRSKVSQKHDNFIFKYINKATSFDLQSHHQAILNHINIGTL